ncbi:hypothetical protein [Atopomonas sediminilitoris]|uniref:hypothetical protein n=1 Tax=Atopomonas sediminilitoris TaxID=2919919 RepID=UPI001F4ECCB1|nr:hypothetical protein [Atopomonas sediminilitoris]MCJ8169106.1 hypothetical protein [Atopomonas sediminilitoris]
MPTLTIKTHAALLLMSFITWGVFVLVGWPDYYQSWPLSMQIGAVVAVTLIYIPLSRLILQWMTTRDYLGHAWWLALYLTVPLFCYDVVYIKWIGGEDWGFLYRYWYLTLFYFSFWLQFPLVAKYWLREPNQR